jgi:hypothetical protein
MRTFECSCGNPLYFENTKCLACGLEVGWCPACRRISALEPAGADAWTCSHADCRSALTKCRNYSVENICNRCWSPGVGRSSPPLCDSCRLTDVIPDLTVAGNREKWYRLEVAKRRLLYLLDSLGLPYGRAEDNVWPPLSFDFKSDVVPPYGLWRTLAAERIYTGHLDGKITINLREADDAEREKLRVDMHESQRTLAGHFRHEIGHYYWQMLVARVREPEFKQVFGDHEYPAYPEALENYYRNGPPADWQTRFVSAYASSHPWEDFAETFAHYLDMAEVLDTAGHSDVVTTPPSQLAELDEMIAQYQRVGIAANELNRSMGLLDLVPEIVTPSVREKLRFVDQLVRCSTGGTNPPPRNDE